MPNKGPPKVGGSAFEVLNITLEKMGIVSKLNKITLERDSSHRAVECTYSIVHGGDGERLLQIDTYGSAERQIPGKKSQCIRFTPDAIKQLKGIIETEL